MEKLKKASLACFILSALLFIAMGIASAAAHAGSNGSDNQSTIGPVVPRPPSLLKFDRDIFSRIIRRTNEEATKKFEWDLDYQLVKHYLQNGYFDFQMEKNRNFVEEEWLSQIEKKVKNDIRDVLYFSVSQELRSIPLFLEARRITKGLTRASAERNPIGTGFKITIPSWKNDIYEIERQIEDVDAELKLLENVSSFQGQQHKLRLRQEKNRLQFELNEFYVARAKISIRSATKFSGQHFTARLSPVIMLGYRNLDLEIIYNLQNKTDNSESGFEIIASKKFSPSLEARGSYNPSKNILNGSLTQTFAQSSINAHYQMLMDSHDQEIATGYTVLFGKRFSLSLSGALSIPNDKDQPYNYSIRTGISYMFK